MLEGGGALVDNILACVRVLMSLSLISGAWLYADTGYPTFIIGQDVQLRTLTAAKICISETAGNLQQTG